MSPANQVLILAAPGGFLILRVADNSGRAEFSDRQILDRAGLRADQTRFSLSRPCRRSRSPSFPSPTSTRFAVTIRALAVFASATGSAS